VVPEKISYKHYVERIGIPVFLSVAILEGIKTTVADPDLWGYLLFGWLFWESGQFPYQDVFSYLPTINPWVYHEWLTGVIFYPLYKWGGAAALQLLKYGFGLVAFLCVFFTAWMRGANRYVAGAFTVITLLFSATGYSPIRAQVFTYAFFGISLFLLERSRMDPHSKGIWLLVPLHIFWSNLHGGFVAGLGLIAIFALGEAISKKPFVHYGLVFGSSALATLINPYGLDYWIYLFKALTMPRPYITEWASIIRGYQLGLVSNFSILFLVLYLTTMALVAWWAKWREVTPILGLVITFYLSLKHLRHGVFFLLMAGVYFPSLLTTYLNRVKGDLPYIYMLEKVTPKIIVSVALVLFVFLGGRFMINSPLELEVLAQPDPDRSPLSYPVEAINYIKRNQLSGDLLVNFAWGEYAIWNLYPKCRVALDGRYETVYSDAIAKLYFDFLYGHDNWRDFLIRYPPAMILIIPQGSTYNRLLKEPNWDLAYRDAGCALFLRR
jgi:hypothetical protein